jgi:hypothetical protein
VVRILKGSHEPKDNLTGAEWKILWSLKASDLLTVLPADKGKATVVLSTSDYNQTIATLLQNKAYAKLKTDPTESIEHKTPPEEVLVCWGGVPAIMTTKFQTTWALWVAENS